MKNITLAIVIATYILSLSTKLYAWENKFTHPAITQIAAESNSVVIDKYLKTQIGLNGGIQTSLLWNFPSDIQKRLKAGDAEQNTTTRTVLNWLRAGSNIEDKDGINYISWRSRHHFHDPYRNLGLDNHTDHNDWTAPFWSTWLPLGQSAVEWAISGTATEEPNVNNNTWRDARAALYDSVAKATPSERNAFLAQTMLDLACVLHLLEDMGVPAHARNDFLFGHYQYVGSPGYVGNPFEAWMERETIANNHRIPARFLSGWISQPKAFAKLRDYWDADVAPSVPSTVSASDNWGLAECTNYQLLSHSTIFRPNDANNTRYYFPNPAYSNMASRYTQGAGKKRGIYLNGYGVPHLARWKFLGKYADVGINYIVEDPCVEQDYARITIPRTIDYVSGLANYFFRGRLQIMQDNYDDNVNNFNLPFCRITNLSTNSGVPQILSGGKFEVYQDDSAGNRTKIYEQNCGTLNYGASINITLPSTTPPPVSYIAVYKGNINANASQPDPNDQSAIAVGRCNYVPPTGSRDDYTNDRVFIATGWDQIFGALVTDPQNPNITYSDEHNAGTMFYGIFYYQQLTDEEMQPGNLDENLVVDGGCFDPLDDPCNAYGWDCISEDCYSVHYYSNYAYFLQTRYFLSGQTIYYPITNFEYTLRSYHDSSSSRDWIENINPNHSTEWHSFTIHGSPSKVTECYPENGRVDEAFNPSLDLSWIPGFTTGTTAESYDVYLGKSPNLGSADLKANIAADDEDPWSEIFYNPGPLQSGIAYYWRIDARGADGTTIGDVRMFTTR